MDSFTLNKITAGKEIISKRLIDARKEKKIDLKKAAAKLHINIKYLQALESGNFSELPKGLYGKNFLREYACLLNINPDELINLFDEETKIKNKNKNLFSKKIPHASYFLALPKIINNILIVFLVSVCVFYIGFYVKKIITPPNLIVYNLEDNYATNENNILIQGKTDPMASITINDAPVLIDKNGFFAEKINLKNGVNTLDIVAQKKYSKKNIIIKNIFVR
ncbi:MAG: helix-turn-helix domain-containing protein [bacterium]